jgi:prolipoprotein diacylglyceryltransferase
VLPLVAPSAFIELTFDPIVTIGDLSVRLETLGAAIAIFLGLVVAALVGRRTPVDASLPPGAIDVESGERNRLRADDLLYIAVAAVPGAVIGARIGYALVHIDYYGSNLAPLLDTGQGGLQLSLGVVGGILTASVVARLLGAPLGRWLHALAIPLLLVLALGKGAMILGGSGQGQLTDVAWATAYLGPGPWGSLAPQLPANPSQAYEAMATVAVMLVMAVLVALGIFRGRNGGAFFLGLGLWAIARALVAITWRDPQVIGPLRMDQVISIVIAIVSLAFVVLIGGTSTARGRRAAAGEDGDSAAGDSAAGDSDGDDGEPAWPDPATRPRI